MKTNYIHNGDCLDVMKKFEGNSIDAIVTDPPYGIAFMSKEWDKNLPAIRIWQEALRILKPGGHMLVACGTRTYHRMASNIEDAGFEIRDIVAWVYGSGFPKSLNIGKAVDKLQGNEREVIREEKEPLRQGGNVNWDMRSSSRALDKGTSEWEGWGTALKPAMELFALARKPIAETTVAKNVLEHGTGGINIDACRVGSDVMQKTTSNGEVISNNRAMAGANYKRIPNGEAIGRFPANLIHDGSEEVVGMFPETTQNGYRENAAKDYEGGGVTWSNSFKVKREAGRGFNDTGSAARFFYCAKAHASERNDGLDNSFEEKQTIGGGGIKNEECGKKYGSIKALSKNFHPTIKPLLLMQYLIKLITPPGGIVLDPFCGSGSTCLAAQRLGNYNYIGIELDPEYHKIAVARCENDMPLFKED